MLHLLYIDQSSITDLVSLKGKLNRLGYGIKDTAFCCSAKKDYTFQVDDMQRLRQSKMLVVANRSSNEEINTAQSLRLLAAMLWDLPILFTNTPAFSSTVPSYLKNIVMKRLSKMVIGDLYIFDEEDTKAILQNITDDSINYVLTIHERILIRAALKAYYAKLLKHPTKSLLTSTCL